MNKKQAIQIMTGAAKLYQKNHEDKQLLFLYGVPKIINKEIEKNSGELQMMESYEVVFHRGNYLHLTGVKINRGQIASAIQFYEKCLNNRLSEKDFEFSNDGSSVQKLEILETMMNIHKNAAMFGEFTDRGPKLYSEKVAGGTCGCIGFIMDRNTQKNVPNTLLKKDIRDITASPTKKVFAVMRKGYMDAKYSEFTRLDKLLKDKPITFAQDIESKLTHNLNQ